MKRYADVLMNSKDDHTFETLKILTGGTTSPRIAKLLNFAVSQMDEKETYVEVGVFSGTTLISAAHVNGKHCLGIDKYDKEEIERMGADPEVVKARCLHNISATQCGATLIEKDFREVTKEEVAYPVAVSFIDGKHDFKDVYENLGWLEPLLADDAVVVFDDVNYLEVTQAIFQWITERPTRWDMLAYVRPFFFDSRYISSVRERFLNNGVCILVYHKDPNAKHYIVGNKSKGGTQQC